MGGTAAWEGSQWIMEYRFRYYKDDKVFDSKDVKNWYKMAAPAETNPRV